MPSTASSRASLAALLFAGAASASLLPPEGTARLPGLAVLDDRGASHDLRALAAGAPSLLLPVFTRCTGTCPMTAVYLKNALAQAGAPFRVVVFSFDDADRSADLREFRERFALPQAWSVVRPGDAAAIRPFLDGLGFHFMKSAGGFDHPDETFVFSPAGAWAATFAGSAFEAAELRTARERALSADDPSALRGFAAWLVRPEAWILLACAGLAGSLIALMAARNRALSSGRERQT